MAMPRVSVGWLVGALVVGGLLVLAALFIQGLLLIVGGVLLLALAGALAFFFLQ